MNLRFRVDVFAAGGWQHVASFASETQAYEFGERMLKSRVWDGDTCIAANDGPRSWHGIRHNRDCDGKPCECGAVPPIGSTHPGG